MRVLITGGAGYLGTELTDILADDSRVTSLTVYDNLSRGNFDLFFRRKKMPEKIKFVHGELLDTRKLSTQVSEADVVFHLAARVTTPFSNENPHLYEQVNHWGTAELVYAIENSDVNQFIYVSSASVYGASNELVDVNTIPNPQTFYGISKLKGEDQVKRIMGEGRNVWIIRSGNIYGYNRSMRFDSVINKFIFEAHFKNRIRIFGTGEQCRSFISVHRAGDILSQLLFTDLKPGLYDMVDHDWTVNYLANELKGVYHELEFLYVNQHISLRQLKVRPDPRINSVASQEVISLHSEIMKFQNEFSF
jgi:UDP-glucose 4-epimerase